MVTRKGVHCQDMGPEQKWQAGGGAQAWEGRLTKWPFCPFPWGLLSSLAIYSFSVIFSPL